LFKPEKSLKDDSFDTVYKMKRPAIIKPKFVNVFIGSRKTPALILSHHLDASPIKLSDSSD
jgi:hypothetical protein